MEDTRIPCALDRSAGGDMKKFQKEAVEKIHGSSANPVWAVACRSEVLKVPK